MPVHIIDHTSPRWAARKKNENGAATYSADIVASQSGNWLDAFKDSPLRVVISTCPLFSEINTSEFPFPQVDIIIQYLHTYPFKDQIAYINRGVQCLQPQSPRLSDDIHFRIPVLCI